MNVANVIASSFDEAFFDIVKHRFTHYWFSGGRGSTKSSFISIAIILGLMKKKGYHAVAMRMVKDTLQDSVYAQLLWAIDVLGVSHLWKVNKTPLRLTYIPNGNVVVFRGADDPQKIKSIKVPDGYIAFIWFEELAEFRCMDDVNTILQSVMRGGSKFWCFYSYNPPESIKSWVNQESIIERPDKRLYKSTYLSVPKEWLGEAFIIEAEHLKKVKPLKYKWQYLGEPTGTGGEVFTNVEARRMSDSDIAQFDNIKAGLDWGWSIDPLAYVEYHRDTRRKALYIYHEFYGLKVTNERIAKHILSRRLPRTTIVKADSAEQKSINDVRSYGICIAPCTKGKGSIERTMRHLTDDIDKIYIDPERCPNTYREFSSYELDKDRNGNFKAEYPDRDNHTIDAVRYAEQDIADGKVKTGRINIY